MPMYYPDLGSVKSTAQAMTKNEGAQKYRGVIPKTEQDLPQARRDLAKYFREVWKDDVAAAEVEMAVTKENYYEKMEEYVRAKFLN